MSADIIQVSSVRLRTDSINAIFDILRDGKPRSADQIKYLLESDRKILIQRIDSLKARIRDLRRPEYGGHTIITTKCDGVWFYQYLRPDDFSQESNSFTGRALTAAALLSGLIGGLVVVAFTAFIWY